MEGMKSASSTSKKAEKKKYYPLKNFFGDVKKQNITETTTTSDGMKVKKIIETKINFSGSANFEAKESETVKTNNCLHFGVSFARENGFALHKKAKHSRPDKVSIHNL